MPRAPPNFLIFSQLFIIMQSLKSPGAFCKELIFLLEGMNSFLACLTSELPC